MEVRLWRRIVEAKCGGVEKNWSGEKARRPHGLGLWRKILMEWPRFKECIRWKLGRGDKIRFCWDDWLEGECLMSKYPRIIT